MKKCLIIFIIAIISIIPISSARALVGNDGVEYPEIPDDYKKFAIVKHYEGQVRLFTFDERMTYSATYGWNAKRNVTDVYFYGCSSMDYGLSGSSNFPFSYNYYILSGNKWVLQSENTDVSYASSYNISILYSTENFYMNPSVSASTSTYPEGYYVIPGYHAAGDLTYKANFVENKEYLTYSANKANDLDGIDIYNFRFNANNYNSSYKYLIKTSQEIEWTDITEELNNEANQYDYMLYYNTTLYIQVLNENNEVLETKTHQITDLTDYGFKVTHAPANDENDRYINVITIDTIYIYSSDYKYQYSFDNQVFYDMDITQDNKIFYLNHGVQTFLYFRVLNAGNSVVYNQKYEEIFDGLIKHVHVTEDISNSESGEKQIIIQVDFTEYLKFYDMYNFRILINDVEYSEQDFIVEYILNKDNFEQFKEIEMKVYIDNFLVESSCYYPNNGQIGFDNKYNDILENKMEDELKNNDYTSVSGMVQAVKNFINAIGEFVTTFFELIMYFFNKLNIWIRTCIISLFVELVIFKIIKAVRKK